MYYFNFNQMKNVKIFSVAVALTFAFSACNRDLPNDDGLDLDSKLAVATGYVGDWYNYGNITPPTYNSFGSNRFNNGEAWDGMIRDVNGNKFEKGIQYGYVKIERPKDDPAGNGNGNGPCFITFYEGVSEKYASCYGLAVRYAGGNNGNSGNGASGSGSTNLAWSFDTQEIDAFMKGYEGEDFQDYVPPFDTNDIDYLVVEIGTNENGRFITFRLDYPLKVNVENAWFNEEQGDTQLPANQWDVETMNPGDTHIAQINWGGPEAHCKPVGEMVPVTILDYCGNKLLEFQAPAGEKLGLMKAIDVSIGIDTSVGEGNAWFIEDESAVPQYKDANGKGWKFDIDRYKSFFGITMAQDCDWFTYFSETDEFGNVLDNDYNASGKPDWIELQIDGPTYLKPLFKSSCSFVYDCGVPSCGTIQVLFMDDNYDNPTKEEQYDACEETCFGKWVKTHTALQFGWDKQLCPFLHWEYEGVKVEDDDCDIFDANSTNGSIVLKAVYNCPLVNVTGCANFMDFLFNATDVTKLFPEKCSVFSDNTLYTNYYPLGTLPSRNLTYTAKPIVQQLFSLESPTAAKNATLDYIEITKDNTPLYLTYIHEGAGWLNALGYFVIPASVPQNDADEYDYFVNEIKPNMTTTGNVLKQEYLIFDYIADKNPVNPKPSVTAYQEKGQVTPIGGNKTFNNGDRVVLFMCPDSYNPTTKQVVVTFNPGAAGNVKQIVFMHKYFNARTGIKFNPALGDFAGCQMMTFYAASCESMVFCIEDIHGAHQYADLDFNDLIFTISDNISGNAASSFTPPKWAIGENINGGTGLEILTTDCLLKGKCD